MITLLISRGYVQGAEISLVGWAACAAVYFAVCLGFRANRTRRGRNGVAVGFLLAELAVDLLWCLLYYGERGYVNLGIGGAYGMLLWPAALLVTGLVVTAKNDAAPRERES